MSKKAAIITVNYNGSKFLPDYFSALSLQTYKNFEIYLVDGGSNDNSKSFIKKNYPEIKLISLNYNAGFAVGNNIAIKEALKDPEIEFIVCLNNDTIPEPHWLEALINQVNYEDKIDMVSSMSMFTDGFVQTIGLKFEKNLIGDDIGGLSIGYGKKPSEFNKSIEVYCPSGVSALFTRRLIEEVGLFDEDFFMYFEDFDLGMRARNKGYRCIFAPKSRLIHLHSLTAGGRASAFKSFYIKRNAIYVVIKNFPLVDLILYPWRDFAWMLKNTINKDTNRSTNILKGKIGVGGMLTIIIKSYFEAFFNIPKLLWKRFIK